MTDPAPTGGDKTRLRDWESVAAILAIFAVSRAALVIIGAATLIQRGDPFNSMRDLVTLFNRWDSGWYVELAQTGYSMVEPVPQPGSTNFAFFPVLPLLMAAIRSATGLSAASAGVLVANLAFLAVLFLVHRYALELGLSRRAALLSVVLLAVAPQSVVFSAVYSESLFMLFLAGAMLAMRTERFWTAGVSAALLSATRANGVLFVVFGLALRICHDGLRDALRFWHRPERYMPLVLAPAGLFAFLWYSFYATGDAFAFATTNRVGWHRSIDWPWFNLEMHGLYGGWLGRYWVAASLLFFGLSLLLLRYRFFPEFVFCFASFILFWSGATIPLALLRFAIVLFPIYIGMARALEGRPRLAALTVLLFAVWNGFLMTQWALNAVITT
jgi:hypothetical protein